jgi:hypothetical protein
MTGLAKTRLTRFKLMVNAHTLIEDETFTLP